MRLKDAESGDLVQRRYEDRRVFYVESEEDVQILAERCFADRGAKIKCSSAGNSAGGGCNQVIDKVGAAKSNGIDAFGILDRDALAACARWKNFFKHISV